MQRTWRQTITVVMAMEQMGCEIEGTGNSAMHKLGLSNLSSISYSNSYYYLLLATSRLDRRN